MLARTGLIAACAIASSVAGTEPWRLDDAIGSPEWLSVGGSYRIRYEYLDNPFRPLSDGSDELLVGRLLLDLRGNWSRLNAGLEIQDSRAQLADARTPLGTDDVNALEPLQAWLGLGLSEVFAEGDRLDLAAGRLTIDAGSRRLVARNGFRNTSNAFTGVHAEWARGASRARAFLVLPIHRLPNEPQRLRDNAICARFSISFHQGDRPEIGPPQYDTILRTPPRRRAGAMASPRRSASTGCRRR